MKRKKKFKKFSNKMDYYVTALSQRLTRHELMFMRKLTLSSLVKFDFQVQVGGYIVDFIFPERMLIIEIDGQSHEKQRLYDLERDRFIESVGFTVWRVKHSEVQTWPITKILKHEAAQTTLTYNQTLERAKNLRHSNPHRRANQRTTIKEIPTDSPNFYPQLIKKANNAT